MSRARFKIPDLPPDRPKVPEVVALVNAFYRKPGNSVGGRLHVVLDDNNLDASMIRLCLEDCERDGDEDGAKIARMMLLMTPSQRRRIVASFDYPI